MVNLKSAARDYSNGKIDASIYFCTIYSGKYIFKMAAGDYSNGKEELITLTVFTFT